MPHRMDAAATLEAVAALGDYFRIALSAPSDIAAPSLADRYAGSPALLDDIRTVTERLHTSEHRVGGSILFQGLAARLWSPAVAGLLCHRRVVELDPATTWWSPDLDGGRLHAVGPRLDAEAGGDAREVLRSVVQLHLRPLAAAVGRWVSLPEALLWGNAASALVGSLGVLARARPDLGTACVELAETLLTEEPLTGAGSFAGTPTRRSRDAGTRLGAFVRTSCCLFYRVPGGGLCGDCALTSLPSTPTTPPNG